MVLADADAIVQEEAEANADTLKQGLRGEHVDNWAILGDENKVSMEALK